jgi:hypothetical protein
MKNPELIMLIGYQGYGYIKIEKSQLIKELERLGYGVYNKELEKKWLDDFIE